MRNFGFIALCVFLVACVQVFAEEEHDAKPQGFLKIGTHYESENNSFSQDGINQQQNDTDSSSESGEKEEKVLEETAETQKGNKTEQSHNQHRHWTGGNGWGYRPYYAGLAWPGWEGFNGWPGWGAFAFDDAVADLSAAWTLHAQWDWSIYNAQHMYLDQLVNAQLFCIQSGTCDPWALAEWATASAANWGAWPGNWFAQMQAQQQQQLADNPWAFLPYWGQFGTFDQQMMNLNPQMAALLGGNFIWGWPYGWDFGAFGWDSFGWKNYQKVPDPMNPSTPPQQQQQQQSQPPLQSPPQPAPLPLQPQQPLLNQGAPNFQQPAMPRPPMMPQLQQHQVPVGQFVTSADQHGMKPPFMGPVQQQHQPQPHLRPLNKPAQMPQLSMNAPFYANGVKVPPPQIHKPVAPSGHPRPTLQHHRQQSPFFHSLTKLPNYKQPNLRPRNKLNYKGTWPF